MKLKDAINERFNSLGGVGAIERLEVKVEALQEAFTGLSTHLINTRLLTIEQLNEMLPNSYFETLMDTVDGNTDRSRIVSALTAIAEEFGFNSITGVESEPIIQVDPKLEHYNEAGFKISFRDSNFKKQEGFISYSELNAKLAEDGN